MSLETSDVEKRKNERSKRLERDDAITTNSRIPTLESDIDWGKPGISPPSSMAQKVSSSTKQLINQPIQLSTKGSVMRIDEFPVREAKEGLLFSHTESADPRIHQKGGLLSTTRRLIDLKEHDLRSKTSPSTTRNLEATSKFAVMEIESIEHMCDVEREKEGSGGTAGTDSKGDKNKGNCTPKGGYGFSSDDHENVKDSNSSVSRSGLILKHLRTKSKTSLEGLHPRRDSASPNKYKLASSRTLSSTLRGSGTQVTSSLQLQTAPQSKNEAEGPNEGNDKVSHGIETEDDERSSSRTPRQSHSLSRSRLRTTRSRSYRNRTDEGRRSSANYRHNQRGEVLTRQNPYFDPHFHIAQLQYSWWLQAHAQATNIWMFNNANRGGRSNGNAMNSSPDDARRDFALYQSQRRLTREGAPVEDRTQPVQNSAFSHFNEDIGLGLPPSEHDQYFFDPLTMDYPPLMQMYYPGQFPPWQQQQQQQMAGHQYFNNPNNSSLMLPAPQQQQLAQYEERHTLGDMPLPTEAEGSFMSTTQGRGPKKMDDASADQKLKVKKRSLSSSSKRCKVEGGPSLLDHNASSVDGLVPKDDSSETNIGNLLGNDEKMTSFKHKTASSRYKGVLFVKNHNKWRAQLCHKGKKVYLGSHHSQEDAAKARDEKVFELFGYKTTMLNFPQNFVTRTRGAKESSPTRKMT